MSSCVFDDVAEIHMIELFADEVENLTQFEVIGRFYETVD